MFATNAFTITPATSEHTGALRRLAALDSQRPLTGDVLIGYIGAVPAAAISLSEDRIVADPFVHTGHLRAHLRLRAGTLRAVERTPSLRDRIRAGVRISRPAGAPA